jgi:hypothetical protein
MKHRVFFLAAETPRKSTSFLLITLFAAETIQMQFLLFVSLKGFEVLKTPFKDITSVDAPGPSSVFFLPLIRLLALHLTGDVANACLWICTPLHYSFQWWSFSKCV